jgi:hypothetical protein
MSLFDRVLASILECVPLPPDFDAVAAALARAAAAAAPQGALPPSDPITMTQTALSVLRKLFRNCTPYVAAKTGATLASLAAAVRGAPRDVAVVVERTVEEVVDRLPPEIAFTVRRRRLQASGMRWEGERVTGGGV